MHPTLSIIIPAYNEARYIARCLNAITTHCDNHKLQTEVIVVDNGSTDNTYDLAAATNAKVYRIERSSVSTARNYGVSQSSYDLIAFIDADVTITDRWAKTVASSQPDYRQTPYLLTGHQYAVRKRPSWIEAYWFKNITDKHLNGGNIITSRKLFDKLAGFDPKLKTGEDYDFCQRAMSLGVDIRRSPELEAIHLGYPSDIKNFLKREYWHGEGDFRSIQRFLKSPIAMVSMGYALLHLCILIAIMMQLAPLAWIGLLTLVAGNFAITARRFPQCKFKALLVNSVINYFYFCARAASLFKAMHNRKKQY